MTDTQQRAAAKAFAKNWKDRGYEKGDSQIFWVELLATVFGVTEISQFISFEDFLLTLRTIQRKIYEYCISADF